METRIDSTRAVMLCAAMLLISSGTATADDHFLQQVAPIFQRRCLSCHHDARREGDFSLQSAESALADGFILAGDADGSHLVDLITPEAGKAQMPQAGGPLSADEINAIRQWIDNGAKWPADLRLDEPAMTNFDGWSYQPVQRPEVPKLADPWIRNPVDAFILRQLQQRSLTPRPEADRRTLIRRLTYDLIGLPPTPAEVLAFQQDDDPLAYEKLVDRLLASPHYGERWARHWLDVVKYADTCGYDKDKLRPHAWPYRDYVIDSLNQDKPYGRFVREQIAGDVLYPDDPEGVLGLGFLAAGPWDFIGHVEVPESKIDGRVARNLDRDDMVSNTINTFCSLTVQCARCHHHKFDPITQEDYYGLQAIFAAVDRADRTYEVPAEVVRQRTQWGQERDRLRDELEAVRRELASMGDDREPALNASIQTLGSQLEVIKPAAFGYHSQLATTNSVAKWVQVDLGEPIQVDRLVLRPCHDDFAGIGAGFGFPVRYRVDIDDGSGDWVPICDRTNGDQSNPGLLPVGVEGVGRRVRRVRVTATRLAERRGDYLFALSELQVFDAAGRNVALGRPVDSLDSIEAPVRWGAALLTDGKFAQARQPEQARALADAVRERDQWLTDSAMGKGIRRRQQIQAELARVDQALAAAPRGKLVYAATTQFPPQGHFRPTQGQPRDIHVLLRGDVRQPDEVAVPGVLPLGPGFEWRDRLAHESEEGQRRAALARWLTDPEHPLVWRSIVNRLWQYHFGDGIVATPNDFGRMGARPTHPELLDWLAVEFRDSGQSLKTLHRLMVTSSVYRQRSDTDPENAAIDGGNQYLWRMNRRRLEAEEIRDSLLAISGALDPTMGGPGYYLFELENTTHSPHYQYHKFDPADPQTHRRSIYRFIVRSQPDPWMSTLDCADSSQSTPRRNETLTSLQALALLNNRFNLEMAQRFAQRLRADSESLSAQVERAWVLTLQRQPAPEEHAECLAFTQEHGLPNLCRFLFNLSEFVYLD